MEFVRTRIVVYGIVAALFATVAQPRRPVRVVGDSMAPTYANGEWLFARPLDRPLRRGDVVVVDGPEGTIIKRVALLPGDRHLQFRTGSGWAELLLLVSPTKSAANRLRYASVPAGEVYLLGDHLTASVDSRVFGAVPLTSVRSLVEEVRLPSVLSDVVTVANKAWASSRALAARDDLDVGARHGHLVAIR